MILGFRFRTASCALNSFSGTNDVTAKEFEVLNWNNDFTVKIFEVLTGLMVLRLKNLKFLTGYMTLLLKIILANGYWKHLFVKAISDISVKDLSVPLCKK